MAFKVFTSTTLTAADVNDYLSEQAVIVCTSGTRPTPQEGMTIYETDTDRVLFYTTGWVIMAEPTQTYTPTFANCSGGTASGTYKRSDGWCDFTASYVFAGAGVAGAVTVTTPIAMAQANLFVASALFFDSGVSHFMASVLPSTTTAMEFAAINTSGTYMGVSTLSATVPITWAANDAIIVSGRFQMTTRTS